MKEDNAKLIRVSEDLVRKIKKGIEAALAYETATGGKRKLGITGEVGELLVARRLNLRLVLDSRSSGYDARDAKGRRVEIKTRRSESSDRVNKAGRLSRFSRHKFDYALLCLLDHNYDIDEIWRANYKKLAPVIQKEQKKSGITIRSFMIVGQREFPKTDC